jgi:hypothetical protein
VRRKYEPLSSSSDCSSPSEGGFGFIANKNQSKKSAAK